MSSGTPEQLKEQGNAAFKQKDYARALKLYTQALQANPRDKKLQATLHSNRSQVYLLQKEYVKAIEAATKALDIDHTLAKAFFRRADARMKIGEYEQALYDYRMCNQLDRRINVRKQMQEAYQKNREAKRKDYYKVLGVKKDATADEIKKSYQKLAKKLHPDKCRDPSEKEAKTKQFQEVKEAYDKLKDPESRRKHNLGADDENDPGMPPGGGMDMEYDAGGAGGMGGADFGDVFRVFTSGGGPFGFATMRGSDGNFTHSAGGRGGHPGGPAGGSQDEMFQDMFAQFFSNAGGARGGKMSAGGSGKGGPGQQFFSF